MSPHTCLVGSPPVATRVATNFPRVSSSQRDIASTERDMMEQHDPHNEKGPGNAANVPDPAPDRTGSWT